MIGKSDGSFSALQRVEIARLTAEAGMSPTTLYPAPTADLMELIIMSLKILMSTSLPGDPSHNTIAPQVMCNVLDTLVV